MIIETSIANLLFPEVVPSPYREPPLAATTQQTYTKHTTLCISNQKNNGKRLVEIEDIYIYIYIL